MALIRVSTPGGPLHKELDAGTLLLGPLNQSGLPSIEEARKLR